MRNSALQTPWQRASCPCTKPCIRPEHAAALPAAFALACAARVAGARFTAVEEVAETTHPLVQPWTVASTFFFPHGLLLLAAEPLDEGNPFILLALVPACGWWRTTLRVLEFIFFTLAAYFAFGCSLHSLQLQLRQFASVRQHLMWPTLHLRSA